MAQSGPRKSGAELVYEAFDAKYPEEMRIKWDKILTIKDEAEKKAAYLSLSDEERIQYDTYIIDLLAFEKVFFQKIIIEPGTERMESTDPMKYRGRKPDSEASSSDENEKQAEKSQVKKIRAFSH